MSIMGMKFQLGDLVQIIHSGQPMEAIVLDATDTSVKFHWLDKEVTKNWSDASWDVNLIKSYVKSNWIQILTSTKGD